MELEQRVARLESRLQDLTDREAIREVIHRYCQAVDRCDLELLKGCYHPDGYDDHGFFAGNAHDFADYGETVGWMNTTYLGFNRKAFRFTLLLAVI